MDFTTRRPWLVFALGSLAVFVVLVLLPINQPTLAQDVPDTVYPSVPLSYGSVVHIERQIERDDSGQPTTYRTDICYEDSKGTVRCIAYFLDAKSGETSLGAGMDVFPRHE